MNKDKINIEMLQAYKSIINIDLFNKIVSFIIETTNIDCSDFLHKMKQENMWFDRSINNNIQEEYGFKYFGELLQRYNQRIGTDIRDVRAISFALAYSKEIITEDMIIGTQLIDFLNKIKKLSKKDMYLKAALYLYDRIKYNNLFEDIVSQTFTKTEDIVFVLSLFSNIKQGFDLLEPQLINLLGKNKTISVIDNCGIYNWLINNIYQIIKNNRKKGIELFRALITIPTTLMKEDSKAYKILIENGYTMEEISFLNYISIFYSYIPNTVRIEKSIIEEKIAINFCINILNSENSYSDEVYELISIMLSEYYRFDIKCYGFRGIKEAIKDCINIKVPQTFIKFYGYFDKSLFSFDILNDKWDIVKEYMNSHEYRELFDNYLLSDDFNKEQINVRITKYNKLTNTSYLSTFNTFRYGRDYIYEKLVKNNVISLEETFNNYLTQKNKESNNNSTESVNIDLEHLRDFIRDIKNKKAFEFIKYFLSINNHTIIDLKKYNFLLGDLYSSYYHYYRPNIDIKREFLTIEEERELLGWLETYIFYIRPTEYMDFINYLLTDDFIETLFSKEDLRNLYFTLMEFDDTLKTNTVLRERYLTQEELKQLEKEEIEASRREKILKRKILKQEVIDRFNSIENVNFQNIYKFCYSYRWRKKETSVACKIVKKYLKYHIEEHDFVAEEIKYFNKICNLLIEQNAITIEEIKDYIFRYARKGELILCKQY